jgi:hypothetical protein
MDKRILLMVSLVVGVFCGPLTASSETASDNYRIRSWVQSGGGSGTSSENYQMNSTLGQPSPLMDPANSPYSDHYDLYPGIWYTFSLVAETCPCDNDRDKDVDGEDLAAYILDDGGFGLDVFALNFGKVSCP